MATKGKARPRPSNPPARGAESTYTLTLPREEWRSIKILATLRGQNIREFTRQLFREVIAQARKAGELR